MEEFLRKSEISGIKIAARVNSFLIAKSINCIVEYGVEVRCDVDIFK